MLAQEAVAEVEPNEHGLTSGIFETAGRLFGGAVGAALNRKGADGDDHDPE